MTGQPLNSSHILICPLTSWGHCKTSITFACKILEQRPNTLITFISTGDFTKLSEVEVEQYFSQTDISPKQNLRIVHLGGTGKSLLELGVIQRENFPPICRSLFKSGESIHSLNGLVFDNPRRPDVFICDMFLLDLCNMVRSIPGPTIPVLMWLSPSVGASMRIFGPEELRGLGDIASKAELLAAENGGTASELEIELYRPTKGELVRMFDGVTLYDYELFPQGYDVDPDFPRFAHVSKLAYRMIMESDGIISANNIVLEPEAHHALQEWCVETKKSFYVVGPLLSEESQLETVKHRSKEHNDVQRFLDKIYQNFGARSLLYLSFGSIFWPSGDGIWHVIGVILEMNIPFVFSYDPTRHGPIPPKLEKDLRSSGTTMVSPWLPQEAILSHHVTGWFLSHCGPGSIMESIYNGVPLIGWPIRADQPACAALCSTVLNIAYELVEIRTVSGLKPLYRGAKPTGTPEAIIEEIRTVLTNAFTKDGQEKRQNIEALREKTKTLWKEGGASWKDTRRFIADYLSGENTE